MHLCFKSSALVALALVASMAIQTKTSADLLLTSGASSFNFDTDASGDFSLARGGFPNVLAGLDFSIRTRYGAPGSQTESIFRFGNELTIQSATQTGAQSGQIVLNSVIVPGSSNPSPASDLLIPVLDLALVENARGDAELTFTLTTVGVNFTDLSGIGATSTLDIDTFFVWDYASDSSATGGEVTGIAQYNGEKAIAGDSSRNGLVLVQGDADSVEINTPTDLDNVITTGGDFSNTNGPNGVLSGGFQFSDSFSSGTSFVSIQQGSIVAIPEPTAGTLFALLMVAGFGFIWFDSRRLRRA